MSRRIALLVFINVFFFSLGCGRRENTSTPAPGVLPYAVNINTAPPEDLQKIPYIGETLASRIIAYRETNGPFRRVEDLMLVDGISDKRFRKIRTLVRVE